MFFNVSILVVDFWYDIFVVGLGIFVFYVIYFLVIMCIFSSLFLVVFVIFVFFWMKFVKIFFKLWLKCECFVVYFVLCDGLFNMVYFMDYFYMVVVKDYVYLIELCEYYGFIVFMFIFV